MPHALRITAHGLADGEADWPLLDDTGQIDTPLVVVDIPPKTDPAVLARASKMARENERILVGLCRGHAGDGSDGLAELTSSLTLTYTDVSATSNRAVVTAEDVDDTLADLDRRVAANPTSSTVLRQVINASGGLDVPAAIDVESLAYSTLLGGPEFARWMHRRGSRPQPPAPDGEPVLLSRDGPTLHVTLNRPERRNAYGARVRDSLTTALTVACAERSIKHVVLDGTGPSFCAGGDLDEFGTTPDPAVAHLIRTRAGAGVLVDQLADRIEVRVHGACVGAGIEIPAFARRIVSTTDAWFRLPEVEMGLIPGAGGTVSIPRRIGRWRAMHLFLSGTKLHAQTALDWGLVDVLQ
ncbi:enoyl-CoA hydratase/isomerase family protein [Prescottella equi]|uniref:enoyl-CoA hydratase/isomerase family protein n=1 Tax=Rhodococcus hoagii TaxID=43767 RepID=UPI0009C08A99|nr:enoyl-CoA hydratase/isomerase family protein [Prescottella equi]